MQPSLSLPWWRTDAYDIGDPVPVDLTTSAGPEGVALVRAFDNGKTDKGWGLPKPGAPAADGFMDRYKRRLFKQARALHGYDNGMWNFAFVMRSVSLVCIDIDGKNGGLEHASRLGALPYTLAETSKSGDGYHLFYSVPDEWDDELGFGRFADRIGWEQGVDLRATGCVYHHPQQRWNQRAVSPLPQFLIDKLELASQRKSAATDRITKVLQTQEVHEVLMMQDDLKDQLAAPIPSGRRNNTLFAIGSQMKLAEIEDWGDLVHARALAVGLSDAEATKIVENIDVYA